MRIEKRSVFAPSRISRNLSVVLISIFIYIYLSYLVSIIYVVYYTEIFAENYRAGIFFLRLLPKVLKMWTTNSYFISNLAINDR